MTSTSRGNARWVATKEESAALSNALSRTHWGVFVTKVNKANRHYTHGYIVSWREPKAIERCKSLTCKLAGMHIRPCDKATL